MAKFGQYESLLKQLLKNKDSLASQKANGRNKYQVRIKASPHSKASLDFNPNKRVFKNDKEYREWKRQKNLYSR